MMNLEGDGSRRIRPAADQPVGNWVIWRHPLACLQVWHLPDFGFYRNRSLAYLNINGDSKMHYYEGLVLQPPSARPGFAAP
jgi:hypothetical protein